MHKHGGDIYSNKNMIDFSANINYLSPAMNCEKLICEAREIKTGKRVCVYEMTVTNEFDKVIAVTTITYFYLDKNVGLPLNEEE